MPYDPDFLGSVAVPLPALLPDTAAHAWNDGEPVHHTNYSLVFNQSRGLAVYTAANVDGDRMVSNIRRKGFTLDPDVPKQIQIDNDRGYKGFPDPPANPWDAGHLARRKDVHWPDRSTALAAETDTSRWTNIAPQNAKLNQRNWREVEDWLLGLADDNDQRLSVFTGPVFTTTDLVWKNKADELEIRIPSGYWKVGFFLHGGQLKAAAFLIWQTDVVPSVEDFDPDAFDPVLEQVRLLTIEHLAGLSFGDVARRADPLHFGAPIDGGGTGGGGLALDATTGGAGAPLAPAPGAAAGPRVTSVTIAGAADIVL